MKPTNFKRRMMVKSWAVKNKRALGVSMSASACDMNVETLSHFSFQIIWDKTIATIECHDRVRPSTLKLGHRDFEILSSKTGNHVIQVGTVGWNNGKPNQSYNLNINANIGVVKRNSDGLIVVADGSKKYKTANSISSFYITHLWYNQGLDVIRCAGYYTKENMKNDEYFSCSICNLGDIVNDNK